MKSCGRRAPLPLAPRRGLTSPCSCSTRRKTSPHIYVMKRNYQSHLLSKELLEEAKLLLWNRQRHGRRFLMCHHKLSLQRLDNNQVLNVPFMGGHWLGIGAADNSVSFPSTTRKI